MNPAIILVVDEDTPMRSSMRRSLEREGYAVIEAGNAREALARLKHSPARLVITDIIMPDADGLELVFALHRPHPDIKIIAISGSFRASTSAFGFNIMRCPAPFPLSADGQLLRSAAWPDQQRT